MLSIKRIVDIDENTLYCALFCTHFCIRLKNPEYFHLVLEER